MKKLSKLAFMAAVVLVCLLLLPNEAYATACEAHTEEVLPAVAATCTETGLTEGKKCTVCNEILLAQEEITALGHTEEVLPAVDATCTETGLTEGKKCTVCNEILLAQEEIPALGHTEVVLPAVEATSCTKNGWTEGKKCSTCGEILVAQEKIPCLPHTIKVIRGYDATCTEWGLSDGYECTVCGGKQEGYDIAPKGHNVKTVSGQAATCTKDGWKEYERCSRCLDDFDTFEVIPALGHTPELIPAVAATCTEKGMSEGSKCSVCNKMLIAPKVVLAAHTYDDANDASCNSCTYTRLTAASITLDEVSTLTVVDNDPANCQHRAVIYYLGHDSVGDITNEAAVKALAEDVKTCWGLDQINQTQLLEYGYYVVYLHYSEGTGVKQTVAKRFYVNIEWATIGGWVNYELYVSRNSELFTNHRATVYYLGTKNMEDLDYNWDDANLREAAYSVKEYWGLEAIESAFLGKNGNYVVALSYNFGAAKKTFKCAFQDEHSILHGPTADINDQNQLVVNDDRGHYRHHRAVVYYLGDKTVEDITDETVLRAIDGDAKTYWGLSRINNVSLQKSGNYVIVLHYNMPGGSPKMTAAMQVTI